MVEPKNNCISEKLMMALSPEEFPDEQREIEEHIQECPECREELKMLKRWDAFFADNRDALASAASDCPSSESLVELAMGEISDPDITEHIAYCQECAEQVQLLKDLSEQELLKHPEATPSLQEKLFIEKTVLSEYGRRRDEETRFLQGFLKRLFGKIHVPSLAVGALAAAVIAIVLVLPMQREGAFQVVFSDSVWEQEGPAITKGRDVLEELSRPRRKAALIILVDEASGLSQKDLQEIYRRLEIPEGLGISYDFISPSELKKSFEDAPRRVRDSQDLVAPIFDRTDADYLLTFEIEGSTSAIRLKGRLFNSSDKRKQVVVAQSRLSKERLSQRILEIRAELLLEADYYGELGK